MIDLAYDGSAHLDWVSRYALHLAPRSAPPKLRIIHVLDGATEAPRIRRKLDGFVDEGARAGLAVEPQIIPMEGTVARTLAHAAAAGGSAFLICGSRVRAGRRGILTGTVSQRLLAHPPCHVIAIRVVQPGLLGVPHRLLLPVAGHPRQLKAAAPSLRLFAPDLRRCHVLRVMKAPKRTFQRIDARRIRQLRQEGREYIERIETQLTDDVGLDEAVIDGFVRVSKDWTREIRIHAAHHKIELIGMGATERSLTNRLAFGNPLEKVLRDAPCDVAIHRAPD